MDLHSAAATAQQKAKCVTLRFSLSLLTILSFTLFLGFSLGSPRVFPLFWKSGPHLSTHEPLRSPWKQ